MKEMKKGVNEERVIEITLKPVEYITLYCVIEYDKQYWEKYFDEKTKYSFEKIYHLVGYEYEKS